MAIEPTSWQTCNPRRAPRVSCFESHFSGCQNDLSELRTGVPHRAVFLSSARFSHARFKGGQPSLMRLLDQNQRHSPPFASNSCSAQRCSCSLSKNERGQASLMRLVGQNQRHSPAFARIRQQLMLSVAILVLVIEFATMRMKNQRGQASLMRLVDQNQRHSPAFASNSCSA